MPRGHRAGRKYQLRKLAFAFRNAPAENAYLGVSAQPVVIRASNHQPFGKLVEVGPWAVPKTPETPEIDGISETPHPLAPHFD